GGGGPPRAAAEGSLAPGHRPRAAGHLRGESRAAARGAARGALPHRDRRQRGGPRDHARLSSGPSRAAIVRTVTRPSQSTSSPARAQAGEAMSETTDRTGLAAGVGRIPIMAVQPVVDGG